MSIVFRNIDIFSIENPIDILQRTAYIFMLIHPHTLVQRKITK